MTSTSKVASTSAVLALVLVTVWLFWPSALGGGTTYITTHGISMEPEFSTGDLAVLSPAGTYSVGDVVAYYSDSLETVVMHRIVSVDATGFVTQGDNNSWLDDDRPTTEDILGRLFLRIPQGGKALDAISSPWVFALVGGAASLVLGSARRVRGGRARHTRRRRLPGLRAPSFSVSARSLPRPSVGAALPMAVRARARQVALASGAVALLAAVGAAVLFVLPPTETVEKTLVVSQQGLFSYTGSAERGTTYPTGVVETGDTVWTKLSTGLTVSYANTVSGPELAGLQGAAMRLDVSVRATDGWSAHLNSGPVVAFENGTATASVGVDAAQAAAVLSRHYDEIGAAGSGATLTVTPTVALAGTARGVPFEAGTPAGLEFTLDATSLRLAGDPGAVLATTDTPVTVDEVTPRSFDVLSLSVPIGVARGALLAVLPLALLAAAGGAWFGRAGRGDAADEFLVRHADRIVPVATFRTSGTVIDVSDAESLHRVAERFDTVVLHHAGPEEDVFAVRDVDATYRFVVPGTPDRRRGRPPVPAPSRAHQAAAPEQDLTAPLPVAGLRGRFA